MKKKIRLKSLIIVFTIILFSVLVFFLYRSLKVKNIYVTGNKILKENEIIELVNLDSYPPIYTLNTTDLENKIKKNSLVEDVNISVSLFGKVVISIQENQILYQELNGNYVLSNGKEVTLEENILGIPTLTNNCDEIRDKLVNKLLLVNHDILKRISEIEYKKTDLDKERFLFLMTDGNYVYITLSKFQPSVLFNKHFKVSTINQFKSVNGIYFGLPV